MTAWMRLPTVSMSNAVKDTHTTVCVPLLATKSDLSKSTLPCDLAIRGSVGSSGATGIVVTIMQTPHPSRFRAVSGPMPLMPPAPKSMACVAPSGKSEKPPANEGVGGPPVNKSYLPARYLYGHLICSPSTHKTRRTLHTNSKEHCACANASTLVCHQTIKPENLHNHYDII